MADLLGGRIGLLSDAVSVVLPHLKSGKARALGVTSRTRVPALPEVATIEEQGLRGYALESWILLLAPAGTPEPILARLSNEVRQILARPEVKQSLVDQGFTELSVPRESLPEFVKMQAGIWARLVAESGAKID